MSASTSTRATRAATMAAALGAAPMAHAQADPVRIPLDTERVVGDIGIGCTGIGQTKDDPRWKAYPIRVEASNPGGDLLADVAIRLSGKGGAVLASVRCEGPWVMLKPPPGVYRLEEWMPGSGLAHRTASVSPPARGQKIVTMIFPRS